jgi:uncharacterized protein YpuA (DUF1002 family)
MEKIRKTSDNPENSQSSNPRKRDISRILIQYKENEASQSFGESKIAHQEIVENKHFKRIEDMQEGFLELLKYNNTLNSKKGYNTNIELMKNLLKNCTHSCIYEFEELSLSLYESSELKGLILDIKKEIEKLKYKKEHDINEQVDRMKREQLHHFSCSNRDIRTIEVLATQMREKIASQYELEKQILDESKKIHENNLWAIKTGCETYNEMRHILLETQWYCLSHWEKDHEQTLNQLDILSREFQLQQTRIEILKTYQERQRTCENLLNKEVLVPWCEKVLEKLPWPKESTPRGQNVIQKYCRDDHKNRRFSLSECHHEKLRNCLDKARNEQKSSEVLKERVKVLREVLQKHFENLQDLDNTEQKLRDPDLPQKQRYLLEKYRDVLLKHSEVLQKHFEVLQDLDDTEQKLRDPALPQEQRDLLEKYCDVLLKHSEVLQKHFEVLQDLDNTEQKLRDPALPQEQRDLLEKYRDVLQNHSEVLLNHSEVLQDLDNTEQKLRDPALPQEQRDLLEKYRDVLQNHSEVLQNLDNTEQKLRDPDLPYKQRYLLEEYRDVLLNHSKVLLNHSEVLQQLLDTHHQLRRDSKLSETEHTLIKESRDVLLNHFEVLQNLYNTQQKLESIEGQNGEETSYYRCFLTKDLQFLRERRTVLQTLQATLHKLRDHNILPTQHADLQGSRERLQKSSEELKDSYVANQEARLAYLGF